MALFSFQYRVKTLWCVILGTITHIGIDIRPPVVRQCSPSAKYLLSASGQLFGKELGVLGLE